MKEIPLSLIKELLYKIEPSIIKKKFEYKSELLPMDDPYDEGFLSGIHCAIDTINKAIEIISHNEDKIHDR